MQCFSLIHIFLVSIHNPFRAGKETSSRSLDLNNGQAQWGTGSHPSAWLKGHIVYQNDYGLASINLAPDVRIVISCVVATHDHLGVGIQKLNSIPSEMRNCGLVDHHN